MNAITPDDLQAVAKKYVDDDNIHILVVGNKTEVAEKLLPFDSDGKINFLDAFGKEVKDADASVPEGVTAETVIEDYVNAIGGKEALSNVKDITQKMTTSMMGQTMDVSTQMKAPNKMRMAVNMSGMTVNETKYDGEKGSMAQMGQKIPVDEEALKGMKEQAMLFPEGNYVANGYKLELTGIEVIDGKKAYAIAVESPNGSKTTEYYDMATSLKIRVVSSQKSPQGEMTITNDFDDYREVEGTGVKLPYKLTTSGAMPVPIVMDVKEVMINKGIEDSVFKVEE